jgi:hypothetical protein
MEAIGLEQPGEIQPGDYIKPKTEIRPPRRDSWVYDQLAVRNVEHAMGY